MNKSARKALGKGLHSLLPGRPSEVAPPAEAQVPAPKEGQIRLLSVDKLHANPDQPRRDFDAEAMLELTQSIERDGVIQPLIARETGHNQFQIIAGERRWRAAKAAGLKDVPVIVRNATDQQVLELAIIENIQREDLNPIELAMAFQRMATELELSHEEIGQKTGKQRVTITNAVRLLQLPPDLQQLIATNQLTAGHARALLKFNDEQMQREIAAKCVAEGWSVRQIEEFTRPGGGITERKERAKKEAAPLDANVKFAIEEMERTLGTRVRIVSMGARKGRIEIEYYSDDDLNRIYETIVLQQ